MKYKFISVDLRNYEYELSRCFLLSGEETIFKKSTYKVKEDISLELEITKDNTTGYLSFTFNILKSSGKVIKGAYKFVIKDYLELSLIQEFTLYIRENEDESLVQYNFLCRIITSDNIHDAVNDSVTVIAELSGKKAVRTPDFTRNLFYQGNPTENNLITLTYYYFFFKSLEPNIFKVYDFKEMRDIISQKADFLGYDIDNTIYKNETDLELIFNKPKGIKSLEKEKQVELFLELINRESLNSKLIKINVLGIYKKINLKWDF